MNITHTIRTPTGTTTVDNYTRDTAIKAFCEECMGWRGSTVKIDGVNTTLKPKHCTSPLCPLFAYRGANTLWKRPS